MHKILSVTLSLAISIQNAYGWGREGHAIVAAGAESLVKPKTLTAIKALLKNRSLASIAIWADDIRKQRDNTYNWHFVDIPRSADLFDDGRDCFLPTNKHAGAATDHKNCAVDRILQFEKVLSTSADSTQREEALKFLVHFVGDIHQPFHAIGDAAGANGIHISLFGQTNCSFAGKDQPCNLHAAWDDGLIEHTGRSQEEYVSFIKGLAQLGGAVDTPPEMWANDSHGLAKKAWLDQGGSIDEAYYQANIKIINQQLVLAAVRLAKALDTAFSTPAPAGRGGGSKSANKKENKP